MRILCVIDDLGAGGAQRQLVQLAFFLQSKGNSVEFLTYHPNNFYAETLQEKGISFTCLKSNSTWQRLWKFRSFIRKGNFDAVIAFLGTPALLCEFAAIGGRKWKLVVSERSANPVILKAKSYFVKKQFHSLADFVIANSQRNMDMVRKVNKRLKNDKCKVIYNGLDLNRFSPNVSHEFLDDERLKLVIPASYRRLKNHRNLLLAIAELPVELRNKLNVQCYGDIENNLNKDYTFPALQDAVKDLNLTEIVTLNPAVKAMEIELKSADAVGLFSVFEGLPNAICEGMACGLPVIATAVSDLPHQITEDENGFLCEANSVESIKNALVKLLSSSAEDLRRMGERNREKAVTLFDENTNFETYLKLLS